MTGHANTIAGVIAAGLAWAATAVLGKYGVHLSKNQSHALDLGTVGGVLFVGRRGIKQSAVAVYNAVWNGTAKPTPVTVVLPPTQPPPETTP